MTAAALHGPPIRDVSDTALWVAAYRAAESERPDALFKDPYARRLAGPRGKAIVDAIPFGRSMGWAMVVRTAVMDEAIVRCVGRGVRTVLNLGAGLDARAFRLPLPRSLHWVDVDLPAMTSYRRDCLPSAEAACEHAHVAVDLGDAAARARLFAETGGGGGPMLAVSEGLLLYLAPDQVASLATELHSQAPVRWWLADLISPLLLQTVGLVWHAQLATAGAPLRFAPHDSRGFFAPLGWREDEYHPTWTDSIRLGRTAPYGAAWDRLRRWSAPAAQEALDRMSGVALFERLP